MESIVITCADGYCLKGTFFETPRHGSRACVLICPATAVPQSFYFKFCAWLASQGYDVLVFDYRGIGQSLVGDLRDCEVSLQQWGELDQVAALDWLLEKTGHPQALMIGHSAGGQMMGLLPNHRKIARVVSVAGSTGYFGGMPAPKRLIATLVMKAYLPISVHLFRYARTKSIGLGEDLPRRVALQWRDWCNRPGYVLNGIGNTIDQDYHAEFRTPITLVHALDDWIATPANVTDLLRLYPNAQSEVIRLDPKAFGYKTIGHIDMFRSSRHKVWPIIQQALQAA